MSFQQRYDNDNDFQHIIQGVAIADDGVNTFLKTWITYGTLKLLDAYGFCFKHIDEGCDVRVNTLTQDGVYEVETVQEILRMMYDALYSSNTINELYNMGLLTDARYEFCKIVLSNLGIPTQEDDLDETYDPREYVLLSPIVSAFFIFKENKIRELCYLYVKLWRSYPINQINQYTRLDAPPKFVDYLDALGYPSLTLGDFARALDMPDLQPYIEKVNQSFLKIPIIQ